MPPDNEKIILVGETAAVYPPHIAQSHLVGGRGEQKVFPINNPEVALNRLPPGTALWIYDSYTHVKSSRPITFMGVIPITDGLTGKQQFYDAFVDHWVNGEIRLVKEQEFPRIWDASHVAMISDAIDYAQKSTSQWTKIQELIVKSPTIPMHPMGRIVKNWCGPATMCYASTLAGRHTTQAQWRKKCLDKNGNTTPKKMTDAFAEKEILAQILHTHSLEELEAAVNNPNVCTIANWRDGTSLKEDGHWSILHAVIIHDNRAWVVLLDPNLGGEIRFLPIEQFFAQHEDQHPDTGERIEHLLVQVPLATTPSGSLQ